MKVSVRWFAQCVAVPAVSLAASTGVAAAPDVDNAPRHCGTVSDLIGASVLPDDDGGIDDASRLAITQAGFNARASTPTNAAVESGRRGVAERTRLVAVAPWIRVRVDSDRGTGDGVRLAFGAPVLEYYSRRSRSYQRLSTPMGLSGALCDPTALPPPDGPQSTCVETRDPGRWGGAAVVSLGAGLEFAGRWPAVSVDVTDVVSLIVSVPVRVRSPDARPVTAMARTGADYHEQPGRIQATPYRNAGSTRLVRLGPDWRAVGFATVADAGQQLPGGGPGLQLLLQEPPPCTVDARLSRWDR